MAFAAFSNRVRRSIAGRTANYSWRGYERLKSAILRAKGRPPKGTVFIFGCQRSGTTHLERLFRADPRSVVHSEFSNLSVTPDRTYWVSRDEMRARMAEDIGGYRVVRSLLASHHAIDVLNAWPEASAFWVFRDANSVVASMMHKWGGDFFDISKRVETGPAGDWELAELWDRIHAEARDIAPDADGDEHIRNLYALFWLYRNQLALDLNLAKHPRVIMADYADVTKAPEAYIDQGLALAGIAPVGWRYRLETRQTDPAVVARKPRVAPAIQERCDALYAQLREAAEMSRAEVVRS